LRRPPTARLVCSSCAVVPRERAVASRTPVHVIRPPTRPPHTRKPSNTITTTTRLIRSLDTLGISEYAAKALGDVVYIELPQVDLEVSEGDAVGAVESVKSASDILTPVSGTVTEINSDLETKPGNINKDPEGEAWIAKISVSEEPTGKMMTKAEYTEFTEEA
jgi:glycine cleavage system H protein